jgi:hypothetical protein
MTHVGHEQREVWAIQSKRPRRSSMEWASNRSGDGPKVQKGNAGSPNAGPSFLGPAGLDLVAIPAAATG